MILVELMPNILEIAFDKELVGEAQDMILGRGVEKMAGSGIKETNTDTVILSLDIL